MKITVVLAIVAAVSCLSLPTASANHKYLTRSALRQLRDAGCSKQYLRIIGNTPVTQLTDRICYVNVRVVPSITTTVTTIGNLTQVITQVVNTPVNELNCVTITRSVPAPVYQPFVVVEAKPVSSWFRRSKRVKLTKKVSWWDKKYKKTVTRAATKTVTVQKTVTIKIKVTIKKKVSYKKVQFAICR